MVVWDRAVLRVMDISLSPSERWELWVRMEETLGAA